ncbi:hypothetical protein [Hymenobacter volaticus]|uniref:Uncharacterized protein n=1 Tax=Hymenobacter volaticus TaxID=2932254 RepID=A0ABY4GEN8_9BACT|nr:hypothetical protein [Hymenobacter volaticus]UOQ69375.1 hypothetical protein MUN86_27165 [Hymenobacter volaticus]
MAQHKPLDWQHGKPRKPTIPGWLAVTWLCLRLQRPEIQQLYLARASVGLALVLLVRRLGQRRWVRAGALALLLATDGLALCGSVPLMASLGMAPGPN